jgi:hypothetical protein
MVRDDGEGKLRRLIVDEAVTGFFGGHKAVPSSAQPSTTGEVHSQDGGIARPSPALEVPGEPGLRQGLLFWRPGFLEVPVSCLVQHLPKKLEIPGFVGP